MASTGLGVASGEGGAKWEPLGFTEQMSGVARTLPATEFVT